MGGSLVTQRESRISLGVYAVSHAAVDATCAAVFFWAIRTGAIGGATAVYAALLYNALAFAAQPILGLVIDRIDAPRAAGVVGCLTTALAVPIVLVTHAVIPALVVAGLGNAVFHLGGGIVSLRHRPGSATAPGIFVAPGAAGLFIGAAVARVGGPLWPFALTLLGLGAGVALFGRARPAPAAAADPRARAGGRPGLESALLLVLVVVGLRAFAGGAIGFPWKGAPTLAIALMAAVVLGKALGGAVADRFGLRAAAIGAFLVCLPLLLAGYAAPVAGIAGILVFNMTMPITLVAIARPLPGHEGFAFGLTCLALFVGAMPVLLGLGVGLAAGPLAAVTLAGAAALAVALTWLEGPRAVRENVATGATEEAAS
jgi:FSR family fosmidomycin resistance protein-like MFS transporter